MRIRAAYVASFVIIASVFVATAIQYLRAREAAVFFATALQESGARETVFAGKRFEVIDGNVMPESGIPGKSNALRTAYAMTLARRAPPFGIEGTDPGKLRESVARLSAARDALALAQADPADAALVRSSLYPIPFLFALADLEEARQALLDNGTPETLRRYALRLRLTAREYERAISRYSDAFDAVRGEDRRVGTVAREVSTDDMKTAIAALEARAEAMQTLVADRVRCFGGSTDSCESDLPGRIQYADYATPAARTVPSLVSDVQALRAEAYGDTPGGSVIVELSSSVCLPGETPPYYFEIRSNGRAPFDAKYADDLFFIETKKAKGPLMKSLRSVLGVEYAITDPLVSYLCPDAMDDRGRLYAITETARFAKKHPHIARDAGGYFLRTPNFLREDDALRYIADAFSMIEKNPGEFEAELHDVERLELMYAERASRLDLFIDEIAHITETDLKRHAEGIAFDMSARVRLLWHSAFMSLFLAQDRAISDAILLASRPIDPQTSAHIRRYSELRRAVGHGTLLRDVRAFLTAEEILPP